jgi:hypothetical protein
MHQLISRIVFTHALLAGAAAAQGAALQTPGMPAQPPIQQATTDSGQTDRFSSVFNPALSAVIDAVFDYVDIDDDSEEDGLDANLRSFELGINAWVDPNAWLYAIGVATEESLGIEEAAVHYLGFGSNTTVRGGRFFIDFGKQMQTHIHELRTLERPLPLRTYLGDEAGGDGLEFDHWFGVGDKTAVRWSVGAFSSLAGGHEHEEEEEEAEEAEVIVPGRKDLDEFNLTARLTGFTEVSTRATLQLGASARAIPEFTLESHETGEEIDDLSNVVYGADLTYGWTDDTGNRRWTLGGEYLISTGDTGAEIDQGAIVVVDKDVDGWFTFVDYGWDPYNSVGLQFSQAEIPSSVSNTQSEVEAYYTRLFSEFHRLRLGVAYLEGDEDPDSLRVALQYTAVVGAHSHGINW